MSDNFIIDENVKEVRMEVWHLLHFAVSATSQDVTAGHQQEFMGQG